MHGNGDLSFQFLGRGKWEGPVEFSAGLEHLRGNGIHLFLVWVRANGKDGLNL